MEDLNVVDSINGAGSWLVANQALLLSYAVNIVAALAIIIVGLIIARMISNAVNRLMISRKIDATVADFLSALVRYGIIAFTLIAALGRVGVQTASVIAVLGAAGLAVGLALQGSLSNLAAGVLLVMFRPFRAGEYVDLGGVAGTVLSVQIFSTTMRTADGKIIVIPNGKIIAGNIINFSREPVRRNEFIIGVAYDSDIDQVKQILTNIIQSEDRILKDREMTVRLNELGASSINFVVRVWSNSGDLQNVYWDVLERIKREFDIDVVATTPSVIYEVTLTDGSNISVDAPNKMPPKVKIKEIKEPFVKTSIYTPKDYIGPLMELCQDKRGTFINMNYLDEERVCLIYKLPLSEIVYDFFDKLKSITKGFAFKSEQLFPSINKQSVYMKLGSDGAYHDTSKVVQKRLYDPKTKECIESKSAMTLYM